MKSGLFILTVSLMLCFSAAELKAQDKITIQAESQDSVNYYKIDDFSFVHQLFADVFYMTGLNQMLNTDEMTVILKSVLYKVDKDHRVTVLLKRDAGPDAKIVFFVMEGTKEGTMLGVMTNYDAEKGIFTEEIDQKKSLVRWYFIKGEKLVYRKDLYSETTEKEKMAESRHALIGYYLFDDIDANDSKVRGLIDDILSDKKADKLDMFYAQLYLGELFLTKKNIRKAEEELSNLKDLFEKYKDNGIPSEYLLLLEMATIEIEIIKKF